MDVRRGDSNAEDTWNWLRKATLRLMAGNPFTGKDIYIAEYFANLNFN